MTEQELILTHLLECRRVDLYTQPIELSEKESLLLNQILKRRAKGEPLQYILGECEFMGLPFKVDSRVFIPRPETEILVEEVTSIIRKHFAHSMPHILDLGTGSGNIAISLAKSIPQSKIVSVDISADAIEVARKNAEDLGVLDKIDFYCCDSIEFLMKTIKDKGSFDLIVSNPPYIPTNDLMSLAREIHHEPRLALDGGQDGLDHYRKIIRGSDGCLKDKGWLVFEIGDCQKDEIVSFFQTSGKFSSFYAVKDYVGTDRVLAAQHT